MSDPFTDERDDEMHAGIYDRFTLPQAQTFPRRDEPADDYDPDDRYPWWRFDL